MEKVYLSRVGIILKSGFSFTHAVTNFRYFNYYEVCPPYEVQGLSLVNGRFRARLGRDKDGVAKPSNVKGRVREEQVQCAVGGLARHVLVFGGACE